MGARFQTDLHRLDELGLDVDALAVNSDGRIIVFSVRDDLAMRIWAPGSGTRSGSLTGTRARSRPSRSGRTDAWRQRQCRSYGASGTSTPACVGVLRGHEHEVRGVSFGPDGKTLVSGGLDGTVRVWDLTSHAPQGIYFAEAPVLAVSPIGSSGRFACGTLDGQVQFLWLNPSREAPSRAAPARHQGAGAAGHPEMFQEPPARSPVQQSVWLLFQAENRVPWREISRKAPRLGGPLLRILDRERKPQGGLLSASGTIRSGPGRDA